MENKERGRPLGRKNSTYYRATTNDAHRMARMMMSGMTHRQIASHYECSSASVGNAIRRVRPDLIRKKKSQNCGKTIVKRETWPLIISLREQRQTYEQIAQTFGITRERVRQIINLAGRKDLIGFEHAQYYIDATLTCAYCGIKGKPQKDFPSRSSQVSRREQTNEVPCLCSAHWLPFLKYRRSMQRAACYAVRYSFIIAKLAEGSKMHHMGGLWGIQGSKGLKHVWGFRIKSLYENSLRSIHKLETEHPWLKQFYQAWLSSLVGAA